MIFIRSVEKPDLKDVLNIDEVLNEGNKKIAIYAGVGAGKSSWVEEVLTLKGSVLWVTSRKAPVEQVTNKEQSVFRKKHKPSINDNQTHVTNALLSKIIQYCMKEGRYVLDEFISYYDFVVVDEAHALVSDSTFAESSMDVLNFAEYVSSYIKKPVIFMTGTPEPIQYYLQKNKWHVMDYRKICKYVHPASVCFRRKKEINHIILKAVEKGQVIYFVNHIEDIAKTYNNLVSEYGFELDEIAIIVSKSTVTKLKAELKKKCNSYFTKIIKEELQSAKKDNKEDFDSLLKKRIDTKLKSITDYNETVYQSLINDKCILEKCKIVLSTSTLREGVNIFNKNMTIICDNHVMSNVIQFWGRVRLEGTKVYMIEDSNSHTSNLDEMLYECASYRAEACNKYLQELESRNTPDVKNKKKRYIDYSMKSNHYVYFNWIANRFMVAHSIHREEKRVLNEENYWLTRLRRHCEQFHIDVPFLTYKEILENNFRKMIMKAADNKLEFTGKNIQVVTDMINDFCRTNHSQHSKLSSELQSQDINVEIISTKYNTAEHRDEVYWYFQKI